MVICIASQCKYELKSKSTDCNVPPMNTLIQDGSQRNRESTQIPSAVVKTAEKNECLRDFSHLLPIIAARTQSTRHPSSGTGRGKKDNNSRTKKRKRVRGGTGTSTTKSSSSKIEQSVVSDDDCLGADLSVKSNRTKTRKRVKHTKTITISIPPKPPLPLPLKLKTSEIHSKKYPFPNKLYDLLSKASIDKRSSKVVSWSSNGMAFVIHYHARFAAEFLPTYFGHTQLRSFDRQLNYWGFELVSPRNINNTSFGGKSWKHPFFQKDRRDLLKRVARKINGGSSSSQKCPSSRTNKTKKKTGSSAKPSVKIISRDLNFHPKRGVQHVDGNDETAVSATTNTSLALAKTFKNPSTVFELRPRIVSPVYGVSRSLNSISPAQDLVLSSLDLVEWNGNSRKGNVARKNLSTLLAHNEVDFLPVFSPTLFDTDNSSEQETGLMESPDNQETDPISSVEVFDSTDANSRDGEGGDAHFPPKVGVFEGNRFHDIDLATGMDINVDMDMNMELNIDMDMDMDMDVDANEAELFLNIIEDKNSNNVDEDLFSSHFDSQSAFDSAINTVDHFSVENVTCI
mmetsp:Transcript_22350/g.53172  ORF Transcript_22350/g.53172 Transcript_22350/m.53172 type:complete len:570 (+) Transcript_22350:314-2023(+)|eukprot:CAMPEP_0197186934 /NCGR_PEP_ID=MMETSP1423-20130617/14890_1 /TAXON_ID=476441 /ORGANISM="Pseudo-nitzschia heimii, Strain UNC1101" /LENGTH=569 /DNA_ID=CAMNT_0042638377 /DNA_START=195 /DNA_END=1904 /DNA_ORIENTATION=+